MNGSIRSLHRSGYSVAMVLVLLVGLLTAVAWDHTPNPLAGRDLSDSTIWVVTASEGLVHDVDATVGRAGPPMRADGAAGGELTTVQAGSHGYLVDNTNGSVRFIDAATRSFGRQWSFGEPGRISFFAGPEIGWAYIGAPTNVLQRVEPGANLRQLGDPIPIAADGDDAVLEADGSIVLPDERKGTVSRVLPTGQAMEAPEPVAEPGNDLALVLVDDGPVVVDQTEGTIIVLDQDLGVVRRCSLGMTGTPAGVGGQGEDGRMALLSPEQGILVVVDLETCRREAPVLGAGNQFGDPLLVDGAAYVPNYTDGTVQIVDIDGALGADINPRATRTLGAASGQFELHTENGLVVFNDPVSAVAGVIGRDGTVVEHVKFVQGPNGIASAAGGPTEQALDDGPGGGDGPDDNGSSPLDEDGQSPNPQGEDTDEPPPADDQSDDPEEPTETETDPADATTDPPPPDPAGPEETRLNCVVDQTAVEVGEEVTYRVTASGGTDETIVAFVFDVAGGSERRATGELAWSFAQAGNPEVTVRGELATGGNTRTAECQGVTVGDAAPPATPLSCVASVGTQGQVNQDITFQAEFPQDTVSWEWDFGGGDVTNDREPLRRFDTPGTVAVTLRADVSGAGQVETTCPVTISAGAPDLVADFSRTPLQVVAGQPVEFFSTTLNPEAITGYAWTFDSASPATATGDRAPGVTWDAPGSYAVTLTVSNADGDTFQALQTVTVEVADTGGPAAPRVAITPISNKFIGDTVSLTYAVLEGNPTVSNWEIWRTDDVGVRSLEGSPSGATASFTIPSHSGGTYEVILTVEDAAGQTDTDTETFLALVPLNPSFTFSPTIDGGSRVAIDTTINFDGSAASSTIDTWTWTFGDGTSLSGEDVSRTFTSPGDVLVTLTVSNSAGSDSVSQTLTVAPDDGGPAVPGIVGRPRTEAVNMLTASGFDPNPQTPVCAAGVPVDQVVSQTEPAGSQPGAGSSVGFSYSDGSDWVMPTLTPADEGTHPTLPLTVTVNRQLTNDPGLDGQVIGQTPAANTDHCGPQTATVSVWEFSAPPPPSFSCTFSSNLFGATATCTAANNAGGGMVQWGDGSAMEPVGDGATVSHTYNAVGTFTPEMQYQGGSYPGGGATLVPDVLISCSNDGTETQWAIELNGSGGWQYVLDGESNRVIIGSVPNTTSCTAFSNAMDALGGSVAWTVTPSGPAGTAGSVSGSGDFSDPVECCWYGWSGGQPGSITMTVTAGGVSNNASEFGIYLSGCG